ncbi:MAG: type I-U CRISPR-associated protein Cas8c [Phycisphaerales bacterium]|nr:type I-U CRISPR-associated protein Cas8c [Phycisphaerales bacterium]
MTGNQICVPVDPANPGQFFACCGLLELAARTWPGATGRFIDSHIEIGGIPDDATILTLIQRLQKVGLAGALTPELKSELDQLEEAKREAKQNGSALTAECEARRKQLGGLLRSGRVTIGSPFELDMDWWQGDSDEVPKPWAGSMQVRRVAAAALAECVCAFSKLHPFDFACVLRPTDDEESDEVAEGEGVEEGKAEPFYFDCTRGSNAHPVDQGFSANKLSVWRNGPASKSGKIKRKQVKMESAAFPAVELLALIGLQRFRPMPTKQPRVFVYRAWTVPLPPAVAAAAACGLLPGGGGDLYRFENAFRTDQRKHKGFLPAIRITEGDTP